MADQLLGLLIVSIIGFFYFSRGSALDKARKAERALAKEKTDGIEKDATQEAQSRTAGDILADIERRYGSNGRPSKPE